jgi:L-lactate dehydrogenase complex protein LldG
VNREAFLDRLTARLAAAQPPATVHPPAPAPERVPLVAYPPDSRPAEERFAAALAAVNGRLVTPGELPAALEELEVRTAVVCDERVALPAAIERLELERAAEADLGVTGAVAACARTGTVVLAASADEPRMASLLPRVHLAVVARDALVEAPGDVLRDLPRFFAGGLPSAFALATGPSRSADIDGELVYGVHGPLAALAVLV